VAEQLIEPRTANTEPQSTDSVYKAPGPARLMSLDALRGFDMFWIIGGEGLVRHAAGSFKHPWLDQCSAQMQHVSWQGFHFYDLIFPLFLFIAGVTIPFSLASQQKRALPNWRIYLHAARRLIILVFLGVVYNGGLALQGMDKTRFGSVLGLIGIGCFFAFLIVMHFKIRGQLVFCAVILLGYWAALEWVPVPQFGAGQLTPEGSFTSWINRLLMPGQLYRGGPKDPEGIVQALSAVSLALIGALAGQWLSRQDLRKWGKLLGLLIAGTAMLAIGSLWGQYYPVIKKLWTGSFIMVASGWSMLLLSLFYLVIDCIGLKKWTILLTVIGMNSITIYMAAKVIDFGHTASFLFGGLIKLAAEPYRPLLFSTGVLLLEWFLLYALYRKKVFLKI
jgi:predicted acyltransferase